MLYKILIIILSISIFVPNLFFTQSQDTTVSLTTTRPSTGIIAPKRLDIPGQRFALSTGQLYIPDYLNKDYTD
ncbi:MAG: hypothetical protein QME64_09155 [bacterium]|nr:hypothetical protein [bacterium]